MIFCASKAALASAWAPIEIDAGLRAIETRGHDDLIVVDLDGCLREEAKVPEPDWDPREWITDMGKVLSGEGELEDAVEEVLERLRTG